MLPISKDPKGLRCQLIGGSRTISDQHWFAFSHASKCILTAGMKPSPIPGRRPTYYSYYHSMCSWEVRVRICRAWLKDSSSRARLPCRPAEKSGCLPNYEAGKEEPCLPMLSKPYLGPWCRFIPLPLHSFGKRATLCHMCRLQKEIENEGESNARGRDVRICKRRCSLLHRG